jgi:hypothetical protein
VSEHEHAPLRSTKDRHPVHETPIEMWGHSRGFDVAEIDWSVSRLDDRLRGLSGESTT